VIKFRCEDCGQKMGVPEKYAGRAVKCTKCGHGVNVPELEPVEPPEIDPSELVEVGSADEPFDDYDLEEALADGGGHPGDADDLGALAELGGDPMESEPVAASQASAAATGGGNCGKCGSPVGPEAVICVQCGNNLKLGVNVKTIARAKATAGFAGKTMYAVIGGAVVACVAGGIWGGIAIGTGYEIGWVAWGIGALVGFAVAAMAQRQDSDIGIAAVGLSILGLVVGKAIIVQWMLSPAYILSEFDLEDPVDFAELYVDEMVDEGLLKPSLQKRAEEDLSDGYFDDEELGVAVMAATMEQVATMSESERDDYAQRRTDKFVEEEYGDKSFTMLLKMSIEPIDALWILLCVSSAWRIGSGGFSED